MPSRSTRPNIDSPLCLYINCCCHLPLNASCGRHLLASKLRPSNIDGAAGSVEENARIATPIRQHWPKVRICCGRFWLLPGRPDGAVRDQPGRLPVRPCSQRGG